MEGATGLVWRNRLWGGGKCPLCPRPCGPMPSPALLAPWGGQGATPQPTHVWVMLVFLWKAFTSREPRMAETCGGGEQEGVGGGRTAPVQGEAEGQCRHRGRASGAAPAFCSRAGDLAHGHAHSRHHTAATASLRHCGSTGWIFFRDPMGNGCTEARAPQAAMLPGVLVHPPPRAHLLGRRTVPLTSPAVVFCSVLTRSWTLLRGRSAGGEATAVALASQDWSERGWGSPGTGTHLCWAAAENPPPPPGTAGR